MIYRFLIVLVLILNGCANSEKEKDQTLRINFSSDPPTLDSRRSTDTTSSNALRMLFDGLTRIDPDGKSSPSIAESITLSEDLKTYTFKLRDAYWTNGDPVTAYDFEYAWKWILSPNNAGEYAYQFYVIKNAAAVKSGKVSSDELGVHVLDPKTLVVELEQPTPYFLELTNLMCFYPINKKTDMTSEFISNGPFKLESWRHNDLMVLKKNENYWDADQVRLKEIRIYMVPDTNTELSMFENGELDWAGNPLSLGLPTDAIPAIKDSPDFHSYPEAATYYFAYNTSIAPLNNVKFRKALCFAIDRKAIVTNITQGNQVPATGLLPPPLQLNSKGYFKDNDVDLARQLFQEALKEMNLKVEELPKITLSYNTSEGHHKIAQAVQQQIYKALGLQLSLENMEWKVYLNKLYNHDFQIGRMSWIADYNDPVSFLNVFAFKTNSTNVTNWQSEEYIRLLKLASKERDPLQRKNILQQAEQLFMNEMPIIPVYYLTSNFLKNPRLEGIFLTGLGDLDFKWAYFSESEDFVE